MGIGQPLFHDSPWSCYAKEQDNMKIAIGVDVHKQKCAGYATRKDSRKDKTGKVDEFNEQFRRFPSNCEGM